MFSVYCPGHGSRVLLFADNVEELADRTDGIELRWRCPCGTGGTTRFADGSGSLREVA